MRASKKFNRVPSFSLSRPLAAHPGVNGEPLPNKANFLPDRRVKITVNMRLRLTHLPLPSTITPF
jgi:hypothetical protein